MTSIYITNILVGKVIFLTVELIVDMKYFGFVLFQILSVFYMLSVIINYYSCFSYIG